MAVLATPMLMTSMKALPDVGLLLLLQPSAHVPASITATKACFRRISCLQEQTTSSEPELAATRGRQRSRRGTASQRPPSYHPTRERTSLLQDDARPRPLVTPRRGRVAGRRRPSEGDGAQPAAGGEVDVE